MKRALVVLAILVVLVAAGVAVERVDTTSPHVREVVVPVRGLGREVTLLQVSDMHGGSAGAISPWALRPLLSGRHIDAAVMTGDVLDTWDVKWPPAFALARVLGEAAPGRVYYLRGNHDNVCLGPALEPYGVTQLVPGTPVPIAGEDTASVALVYGPFPADIATATAAGRRLLVVASHTPPDGARLAAGARLGGEGVRLFIAGHTHGGQIRLPLIGALVAPMSWDGESGGHPGTNELTPLADLRGRLVDGMYERDGQRVFVSSGLGTTWIDARFLDRSEVVLYRFTPAP